MLISEQEFANLWPRLVLNVDVGPRHSQLQGSEGEKQQDDKKQFDYVDER